MNDVKCLCVSRESYGKTGSDTIAKYYKILASFENYHKRMSFVHAFLINI